MSIAVHVHVSHTCLRACLHPCLDMRTCPHTHVHACHIRVWKFLHVCPSTHPYTCPRTRMSTRTFRYMRAHISTYASMPTHGPRMPHHMSTQHVCTPNIPPQLRRRRIRVSIGSSPLPCRPGPPLSRSSFEKKSARSKSCEHKTAAAPDKGGTSETTARTDSDTGSYIRPDAEVVLRAP